MPGNIIAVAVARGDRGSAGQTLPIIEAMKMENILKAARAGTVGSIKAAAGDSLAVDQVIMEFE